MTNDLSSYEDFSLTADSQTIVAVQREYSWAFSPTVADDFQVQSAIITKTAAGRRRTRHYLTKDGKISSFEAKAATQNIWRMDVDGSNPKQLTTDYRYRKTFPSLSIGRADSITFLSRDSRSTTKELIPGNTFFQMELRRTKCSAGCRRVMIVLLRASANADLGVYTSRADGQISNLKVPLKGEMQSH